jgi:hypothetical protein
MRMQTFQGETFVSEKAMTTYQATARVEYIENIEKVTNNISFFFFLVPS